MTISEVLWMEGRKYMWDGRVYGEKEAAEAKKRGYEAQGFETQLVQEGDRYLVYTRRVVTEDDL